MNRFIKKKEISILDDTYCQLCERLITKEQCNKNLFSSRHLHREVNRYSPAYFPQRKLTRVEGSILEKASWKMIFATRNIKEVDEFLITDFMMVTNLTFYFTDSKEPRKKFRVVIEVQFELNLYEKSCRNQLDSEDELDLLKQRFEWWMVVVDRLGVIHNDVYDYNFGDLYMLYREAIGPEIHDLVKELRGRQIVP